MGVRNSGLLNPKQKVGDGTLATGGANRKIKKIKAVSQQGKEASVRCWGEQKNI